MRKQITQSLLPAADAAVSAPRSGGRRIPNSSIARHMLETNHNSDLEQAFRVMFTSSNQRLLQFMEAIAIKRWKPVLCKQKELFVSLALPW